MSGTEHRILAPPQRSAKILRALARALVIACAVSTVVAFAGPWHWYADLFSHFRVQYFTACAIAAPFLLYRRMWVSAVFAVVVSVVNASVIFPHLQQTIVHQPAPTSTRSLRIVSFNMLQGNTRTADVEEFVRSSGADLLVFQEVTPTLAEVLQRCSDIYPTQFLRPRKDSKGAALLTRLPARNVGFEPFPGQDRIGAVTAEIDLPGSSVNVFGIHSHKPTKKKDAASQLAYFAWLSQRGKEFRAQGRPLIVLGDFNATPWSTPFRKFAEQSELLDTSRGVVFGVTWSFYLPYRLMIDHAFVSPEWRLVSRSVGPGLGSDHRPLILDLAVIR